MRKFLRRLSDLPNAYRVLDIMDKAGCDIEEVITRNCSIYYRIKPKWWVSKKDAEDLRKIVLYKEHYKERNKIWYKIFSNYRKGKRFLW